MGRASSHKKSRRQAARAELRAGPAVLAWLATREGQRKKPAPAFPVLDAPVNFLSYQILAGTAQAVAGRDLAGAEFAVLSRAIEGAIPGVPGSVVAHALTQRPDPLETLVSSGLIRPEDALGAGLAVLSSLVRLFEGDAAQTARRAA